jgi:hypothetical protein
MEDKYSYRITIEDPLEVRYIRESFYVYQDMVSHPTTIIHPLRKNIRCNSNGWVNDGMSFELLGYWAKERAADMLPFDYEYSMNLGFK